MVADEEDAPMVFSEEDEALIAIAAKTLDIPRTTIEDIVAVGYTVSEAIDLLSEEVVY